MKVLVTGSSGLIGSALIEFLVSSGHEVIRLLRKDSADDSPVWNPDIDVLDLADVKDISVVVHLAADNIAEGRWNDRKKDRILNSRVRGTKLLSGFFAASDNKPHTLISASVVGFYGDRGEEIVDETSGPGNGFLADVCKQWEESTILAVDAGIRVINIRLGVVLSSAGGVLKKMLLPFRMGLGGVIGSGKQYMSWVSIDDVVRMIHFIIVNDSIQGPVNLVSPNPVNNHDFTKMFGRVLNRPTIFSMPAFAARIAFGEMANEMLLASTRAVPEKLVESGYKFRFTDPGEATEYLLKKLH